jgi:hypothetical protein
MTAVTTWSWATQGLSPWKMAGSRTLEQIKQWTQMDVYMTNTEALSTTPKQVTKGMVEEILKGLVTSQNELPVSQVQVGPYHMDLVFVDVVADHMDKRPESDVKVSGCVEFERQTIFIANGQKSDILADTVLHEINHVIWATVGGWGHEDIDEEMIVSMITTATLDTMRRNKELFKYLIGIE